MYVGSIFNSLSHNVFLLLGNLSYDDLNSPCFSTSSFKQSLKSLHVSSNLLSVSSLSMYLILMPTIYVLSVNPNAFSLLLLRCSDHISSSLSVNMDDVFF